MNFDESMLISMLKENKPVAYEHLVEIYADKIYRTSLFMLGNEDDAKDAVQEVFISIHKNIKKFRHESSLSTWIYRITVNLCSSVCRKSIKRKEVAICCSNSDIQKDVYDAADDKIIVKDAIMSLEQKYRTVIILRDIDGLPYETISSILRLPLGTVKSRVSRGRSELRKILSEYKMKGDVHNGLQ